MERFAMQVLSQQLPLRLMLPFIPYFRSRCWNWKVSSGLLRRCASLFLGSRSPSQVDGFVSASREESFPRFWGCRCREMHWPDSCLNRWSSGTKCCQTRLIPWPYATGFTCYWIIFTPWILNSLSYFWLIFGHLDFLLLHSRFSVSAFLSSIILWRANKNTKTTWKASENATVTRRTDSWVRKIV